MEAEANGNVNLLTKLADKDDHCAQYSLARLHYLGDHGVEKDLEKSLQYLEQAADAGLDDAQDELAHRYMGIGGVERNYEKVIYWLEKASMQGKVSSQTMLGEFLVEGRLVRRDIQKGFYWLLEADKRGGVVAHQILENMANSVSTELPKKNQQ